MVAARSFAAKTVVSHLFSDWGRLAPAVLACYGIPDVWIWKISAVLFAVPMLSHLLTYPSRAAGRTTPFNRG